MSQEHSQSSTGELKDNVPSEKIISGKRKTSEATERKEVATLSIPIDHGLADTKGD